MNNRLRDILILIACAVPLLAGVSWLAIRRTKPSVVAPSSLAEIVSLANARRFTEAQTRLGLYLREHPDDSKANMLMGELATRGPEPEPELAIEHLRRVRPESPAKAALVQFFLGKAEHQEGRFDLAEISWREAIRLDPAVPEAAWALFDLLGVEARIEDAHELGLRIHEVETDPRDRVRILLEMGMYDVEKSVPRSIVNLFKPLAEVVPDNLMVARTLGLSLIRDSQVDEGVEVLREALRRHPDSPEVWDAWLTGLDDAGRPDEFSSEYARLPKSMAADVRFARHAGIAAQNARDWKGATAAYQRALLASPADSVLLYRLSRAIRLADDPVESDRVAGRLKELQTASLALGKVVEEARSLTKLGYEPRPELYQRLADLREHMARPDDALAWHRLVLHDRPDDPTSLATVARLSKEEAVRPRVSRAPARALHD